MIRIVPTETTGLIEEARKLFTEYAASLGFDLGFQNFEEEMATFPNVYSPPCGNLLLAVYIDEIAGCVALRKLKDDICEMKRLYVRPRYRGLKIGKKLAQAIIAWGRDAGYRAMRLDTVSSMTEAVELYHSLGFKEIDPYRYNPIEGASYMELKL
jgi:ribosomal protein S18 acetylase RimI-like enzyme